jgi:hypothetical protein
MRVDISAKTISIPRHCACCEGIPTVDLQASASKKRGKAQYTNSWSFPYCGQCAAHIARYNFAIGVLVVGLVVGLGGMLFVERWYAAIAVLGIVGWIALLSSARSMRSATCVCSGAAVSYLGWHGTLHSFHFVSRRYGLHFMHANRNKLVNLTPGQHQMLGSSGPGAATVNRQIRRH